MRLRVQLAGAIATLVLAEVAARMWLGYLADPTTYRRYVLYENLPASAYQWSPHPYLGYIPSPGFRRGNLSHNSLGFRGSEISASKPAGTYRIAVIGGSTVYGVGIDDDAQTFPAQLERVLRQRDRREHIEVINAGAGAYTSWESLVDLEFRVIDLAPDLVIIYHGVNDVHSRLVLPYRADNTGRRKVWSAPEVRWWERSALLRIIGRRRGYSTQVDVESFVGAAPFGYRASVEVLRQNPPIYFERNLRSMIAVARAHRVAVALSTWAHSDQLGDYAATPAYQQGFAENNEVTKRVGKDLGVPTLDFAAEMSMERRYWSDGRHVNAEGAAVQAESFARFLVDHGLVPGNKGG